MAIIALSDHEGLCVSTFPKSVRYQAQDEASQWKV